MRRNPHLAALKPHYLFPQIQKRKQQFLEQHPHAQLISLGVGDTTEPLPRTLTAALVHAAQSLGTRAGYSGYGPEQGQHLLRTRIAEHFYGGRIHPDEIFISDGAKCDLGRLQTLFGSHVSVAVQNPTYPVYLEGSLIQGIHDIVLLPCTPDNGFFPDLSRAPKTDLIYFCSPNNPTGAVATRAQLEALVHFAHKNSACIIFDAAYAAYIQDPALPRSIFEIEGARLVAIETNSFSKSAGFTGVRLGWTVVPKTICYEEGSSLHTDWNRLIATLFNGPSNISQAGGYAALTPEGLAEIQQITQFYLENARLLKEALTSLGYTVYGGDNAPYLWVAFPGYSSWDLFQWFLETLHLITIPGAGFGSAGEGFLRFSAYAPRATLLEAIHRLQSVPHQSSGQKGARGQNSDSPSNTSSPTIIHPIA